MDDQPTVAVLYEGEAIACRQGFGLAVFDVGKYVVTRIHCCPVVDADQLVPNVTLRPGSTLEGGHEVIAQGRSIGTHLRRQRTPKHRAVGIKRKDPIRIVFTKGSRPCSRWLTPHPPSDPPTERRERPQRPPSHLARRSRSRSPDRQRGRKPKLCPLLARSGPFKGDRRMSALGSGLSLLARPIRSIPSKSLPQSTIAASKWICMAS